MTPFPRPRGAPVRAAPRQSPPASSMGRRRPQEEPKASAGNRKARREFASKRRAQAASNNPEGIKEQANALFDREPEAPAGDAAAARRPAARKRARSEVRTVDPAADLLKKQRKTSREGGSNRADAPHKKAAKAAPATKTKAAAPARPQRAHAEAVSTSLRAWEKLRSDRTDATERAELIDKVLDTFNGAVVQVLQKHDAARVLQAAVVVERELQAVVVVARVLQAAHRSPPSFSQRSATWAALEGVLCGHRLKRRPRGRAFSRGVWHRSPPPEPPPEPSPAYNADGLARVLQSCYRLGDAAQRDRLMAEVKGQVHSHRMQSRPSILILRPWYGVVDHHSHSHDDHHGVAMNAIAAIPVW